MKSRSREINIFSMSALDLFASGMGAFILLAVVGLVFFPNRGDSDERVAEVKEALAEARQERDQARRERDAAARRLDASEQAQQELARVRQELDDARSRLEAAARTDPDSERLRQERDDARSRLAEAERARQELEKRVTEARRQLKEIEIPDIDIVICLDVTGSMGDQIAGLQQQIVDLANVLDALAPSAGVGVVAFGDRAWRRPLYVQRIVETAQAAALQRFVNTLSPAMGHTQATDPNRDTPEAVALALEEAVRLNWRPVSQRRYIVAVTDNPAYPDRVQAAMQAARSFAAADGQRVSTVRANATAPGSHLAGPFLRDLAAVGSGEYVDAAGGGSMIASVLMAVLSK